MTVACSCCTTHELLSQHGLATVLPAEALAYLPSRTASGSCPNRYTCVNNSAYHHHLTHGPRRVPRLVRDGACRLCLERGASGKAQPRSPTPTLRVLFLGNSHVRQLLISLLCMAFHEEPVLQRRTRDECRGRSSSQSCVRSSACSHDEAQRQLESEVPQGLSATDMVSEAPLWQLRYDDGAQLFGAINTLFHFSELSRLLQTLGADAASLTHVVANPGNTASWAVSSFEHCPLAHRLSANTSDEALFRTLPFPSAHHLSAELRSLGFRGRLIWTLPMWCFDEPRINLYRRPESRPESLLEHGGAFVDLAAYTCPQEDQAACAAAEHLKRTSTNAHPLCAPDGGAVPAAPQACSPGDAVCAAPTCGRVAQGAQPRHQCIPGPPDDMAAVVLHHLLARS